MCTFFGNLLGEYAELQTRLAVCACGQRVRGIALGMAPGDLSELPGSWGWADHSYEIPSLDAKCRELEAARLSVSAAAEHEALATALADQCRQKTTSRSLLAIEEERKSCWRAIGQGKKYYQSRAATQAVVIEALAILRERAKRRNDRGTADAARRGKPGRWQLRFGNIENERAKRRNDLLKNRIQAGKLGAATTRRLLRDGTLHNLGLGGTAKISDQIIRAIVRSVGRIADQAEADLAHFAVRYEFEGKRARHHKLEGSEIAGIQVGAGWREILITVRDFCSFGSQGHNGYESRGGPSFRAYLVVRDPGTGEAHILRVPPKFGNKDTKFYTTFASDRARVRAAVAWTFAMENREYRPSVEA